LSLRILIALLLMGFPIALLLAWTYDLTAHGIQATPKAPSGVHQRRNLFLLVATAIILSGGAGFLLLPHMGFHNPITPAWLRLDPVWDQIRNDSRFQQLAAENKP
jgi:hypothetical protein